VHLVQIERKRLHVPVPVQQLIEFFAPGDVVFTLQFNDG
jgi:hypothetical protein